MSTTLELRAEVMKLAHRLGIDHERLAYLERWRAASRLSA
jgi:hypothetical protein